MSQLSAKLIAAWQVAKAAVEADSFSLEARAAIINFATELGLFVELLHKNDASQLTDAEKRDFHKRCDDLASALDVCVLSHGKKHTDSTGLSDKHLIEVHKRFDELSSLVDKHAWHFSKAFMQQFATLEDCAWVFLKTILGDTPAFSDRIEHIDTAKGLLNPTNVADSVSNNPHKSLADAGLLVSAARQLFEKVVFEQVTVTDDVDGAASMADNQTTQFIKGIGDIVGVADILDQATIVTIRNFFQEASAADHLALGVQLMSTDAFGATDDKEVSVTKFLFDMSAFADMYLRSVSKSVADAAMLTDVRNFSASKPTQDGFSLTDSGLLTLQSYCDLTYFAEDYVGVARTF